MITTEAMSNNVELKTKMINYHTFLFLNYLNLSWKYNKYSIEMLMMMMIVVIGSGGGGGAGGGGYYLQHHIMS